MAKQAQKPKPGYKSDEVVTLNFTANVDQATYEKIMVAQDTGQRFDITIDAGLLVPEETIEAIHKIFTEEVEDFREMCEMAGIDFTKDFVGQDMSGLVLDCDVTDFNFKDCRLADTDFLESKNLSRALSFDNCDITGSKMTAAQYREVKRLGAIGTPIIQPAAGKKSESETPQPK